MFASAPLAFSTVLAACASLASAASAPLLNTPGALIACQPVRLTWSGGVAPYYISAIPGNEPSGKPLEQIGTFTGQSTSWTVDLKAGTFVTLEITDSAGAINWASALTVQPGSCSSRKSNAPKAANKVIGTTAVQAAGSDVPTSTASAKAHKSSGAHSSAASKAKSASAAASSAVSGAVNGTATAAKAAASAATTGVSRLSSVASSATAKVAATSAANASASASSAATAGAEGLAKPAELAALVGLAGAAVFCLV